MLIHSTTVLLCLSLCSLGAEPSKLKKDLPDVRCGSYALFVALTALDLGPKTFDELELALGPPTDRGYSIAQLNEQAKKSGARTLALSTNLDEILARPDRFVAICLINKKHFVILQWIDEAQGMAEIINGTIASRMPLDTFRTAWGGECLLLGTQPLTTISVRSYSHKQMITSTLIVCVLATILLAFCALYLRARNRLASKSICLVGACILAASSAGCGKEKASAFRNSHSPEPQSLVASSNVHDLGVIASLSADRIETIETKIRNISNAPVSVLEIQSGCGCTSAALSKTRIESGEETVLTTIIKVGIDPQPRRSVVRLVSSTLGSRPLSITYQWQAAATILNMPRSIDLGELGPGVHRTAQIAISSIHPELCSRCEVASKPSSQLMSIGFFKAGQVSRLLSNGKMSNSVKLGDIALDIRGDHEEQEHRESVGLILSCGGKILGESTIPVFWRSRSIIRVSPSRLWLGVHKIGDTLSGKLNLSSADGKPFRIRKGTSDDPHQSIEITFDGEDRSSHMVNVLVKSPVVPGPWRSILSLETDNPNAAQLYVPVSAIINEAL
ncbi:Protein of unknown function [Singulisphaera sp. GP187]|uniref:DUF1573 domain-containing protein n=1 Tax=Singulisphaera sp. GP187 TaxID=1882752 RepID=UPI000929C05A|nr:DUF1573 domain-containing protein [Singulisphaera sp. GP187]SIO65061.1 Protein of unknown function [Singulisphaera sp. GP187]